MNFKNIALKAKQAVDKRGGTDALKQDLGQLQKIAKGKGTPTEKAKEAAAALKTPGASTTPGAAAPAATPAPDPAPTSPPTTPPSPPAT